jgi:hypothetical protein
MVNELCADGNGQVEFRPKRPHHRKIFGQSAGRKFPDAGAGGKSFCTVASFLPPFFISTAELLTGDGYLTV